jgi:hypothetical protein
MRNYRGEKRRVHRGIGRQMMAVAVVRVSELVHEKRSRCIVWCDREDREEKGEEKVMPMQERSHRRSEEKGRGF